MKRKLTDQDKIDIVRLYTSEKISLRALGRKYGISHNSIAEILKYRGVK